MEEKVEVSDEGKRALEINGITLQRLVDEAVGAEISKAKKMTIFNRSLTDIKTALGDFDNKPEE